MKNRVVQTICAQVKIAKAIMRSLALWIHREGVCPKSAAIAPVAGLFPGGPHQEDDRGGHRRAKKKASMAPRGYSLRHEPSHEHIQTNLGQVCVAVRVSLLADLYKPAHWHQHPQKPEPARKKIGTFPSVHEGSCANREEQQGRHRDL